MLKWLWELAFGRQEQPVLICITQEETWCWPPHLDTKTEGECSECGIPIFYERKNERFRKICNRCHFG